MQAVVKIGIISALLVSILLSSLPASACCNPRSPFREGEGFADTPATCSNLGDWARKAPDFESQRISMHVRGALSGVHSDGTLVYLEMCPAEALRVVCVTYEANEMKPGESVSFGGGLSSINDEWIKLDPCLASRD